MDLIRNLFRKIAPTNGSLFSLTILLEAEEVTAGYANNAQG